MIAPRRLFLAVALTAAVTVLGYGLAAESQSHDTPEYKAVPEKMRARKG